MTAPTLEVDNVDVTYTKRGRRFEALRGISFEAWPGEFVALVGPSGCGKSSLLRSISGIQTPSGGQVRIGGQTISEPSRQCSMVFQSPALLPWRTVFDNAAFGLAVRGRVNGADRARVAETLEMVGLSNFSDAYPAELSGGMQQRVNLARAMLVSPMVLLMDEPFAAVDALTRESLQAQLMQVWKPAEGATVLVTHQIDEAVYLADKVLILSEGPRTTLKRTIPVPLDRPRTLEMKHTTDFQQFVREISRILQHEVR